MKRLNIDEILLQILFFAAGVYILIKIFIPIINPASIATNVNYTGQNFYEQILNKSSSTIESVSSQENGGSNNTLSVLLAYLSGIDLSNPETYIASQIPMLQFIDIASIDSKESAPLAVNPSQTQTSNDKNTNTNDDDESDVTKPNKNTTGASIEIKTIKPKEVTIGKQKNNRLKPVVLIFHTHTTEAYNPDKIKGKYFLPYDLSKTVVKVGDVLEYELENKYGISTIHDTTIHDYPKRTGAYGKARPTVQSYLKKYPTLKLIIDLHRDGDVNKNIVTAIINNEKYARVMFVVNTQFKNHAKNNKTTEKVYSVFNNIYPGFSRAIDYKSTNNTYNQDLSSKMILLEVGSDQNNLDEAIRSANVISKVIAQYLK